MSVYQFAAIDYMLQLIPQSSLSNHFVTKFEQHFDNIIYKSIDNVNQMLSDREPISGFQMTIANQQFYCQKHQKIIEIIQATI